jgi:autophagy-related protein 9
LRYVYRAFSIPIVLSFKDFFLHQLISLIVFLYKTKSYFKIQWSIYYCILNFLFNHKYQIRPAFYLDPDSLRRRFQFCGILHLLFMPYLLFFMTLYFGLQNLYDWKSTKQYFGPRDWSMASKWTFREFNELPHFFERRLAPSYDAAETYVDLFGSNEYVTALGRIFVFIGGSLGAVLLAFAAMNDAILLHVKIGDWNLLWYGGMVGILYSAGKAMIPKPIAQPKSARNLYAEMNTALANVASHTHYYPDIWVNRGWDYTTYTTFASMFQYKIRLFVMEIISLIVAPYMLCVSLANSAESICEFILTCRAEMPGVGEVCGYATFDFHTFHDERTTATTTTTTTPVLDSTTPSNESIIMGQSLSESILQTGNVEESIRHFPKPKARYGKMTKSFFTFKVCVNL